jgi:heme exporter protein C
MSSNPLRPRVSGRDALSRIAEILLVLGTACGVGYATYLTFLVVPNERLMGPVQRIFYFHVGSAMACYAACAVLLVASLWVLATRSRVADAIGHAAGEVGFLFALIVMVTGMIWGHSAWNTWFRWEPRLVTFLLLCLVFFGLNLLRAFGDPAKIPQHAAVLGIVSAVTVPLVWYSVKLLPHVAQLHPQVVENRGLKEPLFEYTMFVSMISLVLLQALLIWYRARVEILKQRVDQLTLE